MMYVSAVTFYLLDMFFYLLSNLLPNTMRTIEAAKVRVLDPNWKWLRFLTVSPIWDFLLQQSLLRSLALSLVRAPPSPGVNTNSQISHVKTKRFEQL